MRLFGGVSSFVAFLRAGYPTGAPRFGYVPQLALLPRRVSDDEVAVITTNLIGRRRRSIARPIDDADVGVEITRVTDAMPSPNDVERVRRRLGAIGPAGGTPR
ncbi:DUF3349 domain-containing protein [Mycobacterium palustre]|uniref:DUF3349 domain-containing protein n=1 Tax=Mycobacterium palustre TaxID=153971 RepID=A0A1X1ZSN4_9MYCO|nr:DUF3349 domain-containing protein [Mycobacterium palustre]MCV7099804.1 DUF3349 domain-containing protein [Mycobacterium palustre]ORW26367.1 hypothetical protein AWC19_04255 [Mycobacterium palustre]